MQQKRRKHKRFRSLTPVKVTSLKKRSEKDQAVVVNISQGGLAFVSSKKYLNEESLNIRFSDVFNVCGLIKRVNEIADHYIYGVKYSELSPDDRYKLAGFLYE